MNTIPKLDIKPPTKAELAANHELSYRNWLKGRADTPQLRREFDRIVAGYDRESRKRMRAWDRHFKAERYRLQYMAYSGDWVRGSDRQVIFFWWCGRILTFGIIPAGVVAFLMWLL
jgi:hypothetical protein